MVYGSIITEKALKSWHPLHWNPLYTERGLKSTYSYINYLFKPEIP